MAYFSETKLTEITLLSDAKYWVKVLASFKWGQTKQFVDVNAKGEVDFTTTADKILLAAIKEWNLDNEAGEVLPVTPENIDLLEQADVLAILDKLNLEADPDSKKN